MAMYLHVHQRPLVVCVAAVLCFFVGGGSPGRGALKTHTICAVASRDPRAYCCFAVDVDGNTAEGHNGKDTGEYTCPKESAPRGHSALDWCATALHKGEKARARTTTRTWVRRRRVSRARAKAKELGEVNTAGWRRVR